MKKKYNDKFEPHNFDYSPNENKYSLSEYYIEVGRECYKYEGLKNKKNDILIYSTILAGLNNKTSYMYSYPNSYIANRLAMNDREVRRAISNLEELKLIKVTHPSGNKRSIKVLKDLRYPPKEARKRKKNKDFIKVYDRIFYYPLITKPMVHVYSYYLALTNMPDYPGFSTVSYRKVAEALGYSEKHVMDIIKDMINLGLMKKISDRNSKAIRLEVDFSKKQPKEIAYEEYLNQMEAKRLEMIEQRKQEEQEKRKLEVIAYKEELAKDRMNHELSFKDAYNQLFPLDIDSLYAFDNSDFDY